jgi:hypothetical protein
MSEGNRKGLMDHCGRVAAMKAQRNEKPGDERLLNKKYLQDPIEIQIAGRIPESG